MDLFEKITQDIKAAMLAKDTLKLEALRGVKKEFLEAKAAKGGDGELLEEVAIKIVTKMIKQRKDAAEIFDQQNRPELAEKEREEARIIGAYLPEQMSMEDLKKRLCEIIAQTRAQGVKDLGKVMGIASKELSGKAEGRMISEVVKSLLSE